MRNFNEIYSQIAADPTTRCSCNTIKGLRLLTQQIELESMQMRLILSTQSAMNCLKQLSSLIGPKHGHLRNEHAFVFATVRS